MEKFTELKKAIESVPLIDAHAHNIVALDSTIPFISCFSEASGDALSYAPHTLCFKEYQDKLTVVKIDHDSNPKLIEEHKVYGLPTLILFKDGKEVPESRREGAITKVKLKDYVDTLLQSVSVV